MRLVAGPLQQLERRAASRQHERLAAAREVHFFLSLREAHDRQLVAARGARRIERRAELPLAAIDDHEVRKHLLVGDPSCQIARHDLVHRGEVVLRRSADPKPPVLRLFGAPCLEPDQRAHRVAPLVGRDVDAHERSWHHRETQVPPQREHRIRGTLIDVEALDLEAVEQVPGILIRELGELRARAPLRYVPVHVGSELRKRWQVLRRKWQQHPARAHLEGQIAAHQEGGQNRTLRFVLRVLEEPVVARNELAGAHPEDHAAYVIAVSSDAHGVRVAPRHQLDRLRLLQLIEPLQRIPHLCGALEIELARRLLHTVAQPGAHIHSLALQEHDHVVDHAPVVGLTLQADAGRATPLDVVVEAGARGSVGRQVPVTGAHGEDAADDLQRLAQRRHVRVGPEIAGSGDRHAARHQHPREGLREGHRDSGIALVVGEPDVEPRAVLLDEVVLEQQRLRLVRNDDRFEIGDLADERGALRCGAAVRTEVARHPRAQALGFPNVQDPTADILPEVDAGPVGQGL